MEPEGSLQCSQEPVTRPCPETEDSSAHRHSPFKVQFNILLLSDLHSGLQSDLFPAAFLSKI
jgi:hypothetical protein